MNYHVEFKDMSNPESDWIIIDIENVDTMLTEEIWETVEFNENTTELEKVVVVAKAIHHLYDDFHSIVIDDKEVILHHFISELVDIINPDWLEHLSQTFYVTDEHFDAALKYHSSKLLMNALNKKAKL